MYQSSGMPPTPAQAIVGLYCIYAYKTHLFLQVMSLLECEHTTRINLCKLCKALSLQSVNEQVLLLLRVI